MQHLKQVHDGGKRHYAHPGAATRRAGVCSRRLNFLAVVLIMVLAFPNAGLAAPRPMGQEPAATQAQFGPPAGAVPPAGLLGEGPPYAPDQETALDLRIISSPWAVLDHNDPGGLSGPTPKVFVVEAVVTNTGALTATELLVTLDYNEDPANNWVLVPGESPIRTQDELAPGAACHAYWFARYSTVINASHVYTVTAAAANATPVASSDNYYGNPEPGRTVKTRPYVSTGNSGVIRTSANVVVGVAFTVTVDYDLGSHPQGGIFSPVGNPDFDPNAYRLLSSQLLFYNDAHSWQLTVPERLYYPTLPAQAENAKATYTFIALQVVPSRLCPYAGIDFGSQQKYDRFYCRGDGIIPITGTVTFDMEKSVNALQVQQGQELTYTLRVTNSGTLPLVYIWVWDEVNPAHVSIVTPTIQPPSDPDETTADRVAWYLDTVPPGTVRTLSFAVLVDGNGLDLADGTAVVNNAFFGVNPGGLPASPALTDTVTTILRAPAVAVSKSDGRTTAQPGETLTYQLHITNSGSVLATGLVISDVLPADVVYVSGSAVPPETSRVGQTLVWNNLGPIAANGGTLLVTLPVVVGDYVPEATVLTDTLTVRYANPVGYIYSPKVATDTTTVQASVLAIAKSDFPDPVLSGRLITYTLRFTNSGSAAADHLVITDVVPLSTTFDSCGGGLACALQSGVVSWTVGTLPAGGQGTVYFSVQVKGTLPTGTLIRNADYGLRADHHPFVAGPPITTLVNRNAGFIDGYAFVDRDGDGTYDGGDSGLPGVLVTLPAATVPVMTTDGSGYYRFRIETQQAVSVSAALPAGYFRTTPGVVFLYAYLEQTQTVSFGYAPLTSTFGVIYGTVFADLNHDALQELGEPGLSGVTVASAQASPPGVTTNAYGQYTLHFGSSGPVILSETNPPFYVSTTPDTVYTNAVVGSSGPSPIDFGDFRGIHITGQVFEDLNVNGAKDVGEGGLAGVTISASGESSVTAGDGNYELFVSLADGGPVLIQETDLPGYLSTNAIPGTGMTRVDANTLRIDDPISGTVYSGGDFGDVLASTAVTISGVVWDDNGAGGGGIANGVRDGSEPGLAGARVVLSSGLSQLTAADGVFLLYGPRGEAITLTEVNPAGYASTNAIPGNAASKWDSDTLLVDALAGGSTSAGNLFGDVQTGSAAVIAGTVFDDSNENGLLDGGEVGLPGLLVTLEISGGNAIAVHTDAAGHYQLAMAPGQMARLVSAGPGGTYYPTTPESVMIRPSAPGLYPGNDFGYSNDVDVAVIYGLVYDDKDGDGSQGYGELGLAGAVITLSNGAVFTTAGNGLITGTFAFSVPAGSYLVHETNPAGYRSTTPDDVLVEVALRYSYFVDFGDTGESNVATIYGTVFDDYNADGVQDPGEPGMPGVVVSVTVGGGAGVITTTTRDYGQYSYGFDVAEAGYHTVSEHDPAASGYHSTTPDSVNVHILLGHSYMVNFGDTNTALSTILGTVFNDVDGDGQQDPPELGLPGVPLSLSNGMTATTGAYGGYTFPVSGTGIFQVVESDLPGYHSTTPNVVTVRVPAPGSAFRVDFGDRAGPPSSFFGTVFDDQNVNGAWDLVEPPLAGVTVTISTIDGTPVPSVVRTNVWGQYTFLIEVTGTYTVTETDLPGYLSTNAIPGDPAVVKLDNNTMRATVVVSRGMDLGNNLFGDVQASQVVTISGHVWDDNGAGGGQAGNGQEDGLEPPLAGAVVQLSSGLTQTTGTDGAYLLYAPASRAITVTERNPVGYLSTNAVPGPQATKVDNDTLVVGPLPGGSDAADNLFGDVQPADVGIAKSGWPGAVLAGETLTYTLAFSNAGPFYAQDAVITDTLPTGVYFGGVVSQPAGLSGPSQVGSNLTWYTPTLAAGSGGGIVFTATVDPAVPTGTVLLNNVQIRSNMPDTNPENDQDEATTYVGAAADLSVAKTDEPDPVAAGAVLTYTLTWANHGVSSAQGLYITDTLPLSVTFGGVVRQEPPLPYFAQDGRSLTWYTPTLAPGAAGSIVFTVTVDPAASGTIVNSVAITGTLFDPLPGDNYAEEPTSIGAPGLATLYGWVYNDANGSGVRDPGEAGLPDVVVTLDGTWQRTTDANGRYYFLTAAAGWHRLVETDPAGYSSTTPNEVHVNVVLGNSYEVDFGDILTSTSFGSIYGTVFEDLDADGQWDAEEGGLAGVTLTLDGLKQTPTNVYGSYTLSTTVPGLHTVVETDLPGYVSTTPNEVHVDVEMGRGYQVDFGDILTSTTFATIYGTVFEDLDADGLWDAGERGLANVTLTLDGLKQTTTNLYGSYGLSTTVAGWHRLVETDPPGYSSTTPNDVLVNVVLGNAYLVDFGDAPITSTFAAIYGTVFEDLDADGERDGDEGGLANVTVTLDGVEQTATNLYGCYTLSTTVPGMHTVVETDPSGYVSTTPNEVHVDVAMGLGYEVDFGDTQACTCAPDAYEEDDLPTEAAPFVPGIAQAHDFCDDAADWVTLTAEVGDYYTLTTSAWGQRADTVLELYDRDGTTLLLENDDCAGSADYSSCIYWQAAASGIYYVRTANRAGLEGCQTDYNLDIARLDWSYVYLPSIHKNADPGLGSLREPGVFPTGLISHTCPDAYEPDDTWEQARPGVDGAVQIHSLDSDPIYFSADKDWIQFDLRARQAITFTVLQLTGTQTLLELYGGDGQGLDVTGTTQLVWTAPQAGRYYLAVSPVAPAGYGCANEFGYRLLLEVQPFYRVYLPLVIRRP